MNDNFQYLITLIGLIGEFWIELFTDAMFEFIGPLFGTIF